MRLRLNFTNNSTLMDKSENVQKKFKIMGSIGRGDLVFNINDVYLRKCKQIKVLPMRQRFVFNDITLFHKISNNLIPLKCLIIFRYSVVWIVVKRRLHSCHLDRLSCVSSFLPRGKKVMHLGNLFSIAAIYFEMKCDLK